MTTFENWLNRRKGKQIVDLFKLDTQNKTPEENVVEIIQGLYLKAPVQNDVSPTNKNVPQEVRTITLSRAAQHSRSDSRKLAYFNALVTLLCNEDKSSLGFTTEELMTCIRISLVDESMAIRAAALRVLRYLIKIESDVAIFNALKLPYLIIRSMDLMLRNEEERAQALRVVRRVIAVVGAGAGAGAGARRHRGAFVEPGLLRCLAAIARAGNANDGSGDRLSRPAIATLAEIGVINPALLVSCGGVGAVTRYLGECATPRMAEALCGALLHMLDSPHARRVARLDLRPLCAPYCDFQLRPNTSDSSRDEREMRFTCSRLSLLCVLRSWPGVLHFCHPYSAGGLRALVRALHLPRLEVRKAILDLLYELLGLPQPEWTDEISVALGAVDPSDFQDSWRLNEGFVAAEGNAILPHLSAIGPDITEIHLALLLQCFLEAGLLDGLAEVIVTSDTFISVRATVLLGQLLHLIHTLLPPQICNTTPALPALISQASAGKPQALAAVVALKRLHAMLEARPATASLFLDHIVQYCSGAYTQRYEDTSKSKKEKDNAIMALPKNLYKDNSIEILNESDNEEPKQRHSIGSRVDVNTRNVSALVKSKSVSSRTSAAVSKVTKTKFFNLFERESDSLIRCSMVMQNKDGNTWNWEIIRTILKEHDTNGYLNLDDSGHRAWVARLINYLRPSSNKYSHGDLGAACHAHAATRAACQLVRQLLRHSDPDTQRLLQDLFEDVSRQVAAIETGRKAHECLFSPQHMSNTMCQMYFLFIGQLCHSQAGLALFKSTKLHENLLELSTNTHHSCYVKLVISSLDYTIDSYPREILAKTLTCSNQASRLYATQFLNVLLRASQKSRELVRKKMKRKVTLQDQVKPRESENSNVDMETWILQRLVGQVKDESKVVVKTALSILEEACNVPAYLDKLVSMKSAVGESCRLDKTSDPQTLNVAAVGDRGYLLWLNLEAAALTHGSDAHTIAFLKRHLEYWTRFYNYRYVRLVEAEIHEALTLGGEGAGGSGGGGEARGARGARRGARPPPHLHGALARQLAARAMLTAVLPIHYKIIKQARCGNEQEIMDLKASLWALGNTATSAQGMQSLMQLSSGGMEDSVPVLILRLAKYCPVYSVRAAAFYVLGLVGSTHVGANLLFDLGWLCVRHTRHDQFPLIEDENPSGSDTSGNLHYLITSPHRRRYIPRHYDVDISEHSDQSNAESLHSDHTKYSGRIVVPIEHHRRDQDTVDSKGAPDKRKSHTLPTQGMPHDRPALTESRTVDIIRDYSNYERPVPECRAVGRMNSLDTHERVRNTSESSTSGVSSCDSVLGRYAFPERVLTLSPIPSSSSLYGMKQPRPRRVSAASFTAPDAMNSPPSQKDMVGYATLKSLNRHRRPHLSESSATGPSELEELSWILNESARRSKPFSSLRDRGKATRERMAKLSLLDYDWKPIATGTVTSERGDSPAPERPAPPSRPPPREAVRYIGICLPLDLMELFPRGEGDEATVDSFAGDTSFLLDSSTVAENKLRTSTENTATMSKGGGGGVAGSVGGGGGVGGGAGEEAAAWRHSPASCLVCVRTRPPSAHELREAFFADLESPKQGPSLTSPSPSPVPAAVPAAVPAPVPAERSERSPRAELLHHAHYMANPIHHRATRPALIALKQRHPEVFKSACVYSDVCALLANSTYMMCARRFLQELFLDVAFDSFNQEPRDVLGRRQVALSSPLPPPPPPPPAPAPAPLPTGC